MSDADREIHKVDGLGRANKVPGETFKCIDRGLELTPQTFVFNWIHMVDPNSNSVIDIPFPQRYMSQPGRYEYVLVQGEVDNSPRRGWAYAHCCATDLLPKSVPKLYNVALHDNFQSITNSLDSSVGEAKLVAMLMEIDLDLGEGNVGWNVGVHGASIAGEEGCIFW